MSSKPFVSIEQAASFAGVDDLWHWRYAEPKRSKFFAAHADEWFIEPPHNVDADDWHDAPLAWVDVTHGGVDRAARIAALRHYGAMGCRAVVFQSRTRGAVGVDTPMGIAREVSPAAGRAVMCIMAMLNASRGDVDPDGCTLKLADNVVMRAHVVRDDDGATAGVVISDTAGFFGMDRQDKDALVRGLRALAALYEIEVTAPLDAPFGDEFEAPPQQDDADLDPATTCTLQPDEDYMAALTLTPRPVRYSGEAAVRALFHESSLGHLVAPGTAPLDPGIARRLLPTVRVYMALVERRLTDLAAAHPVAALGFDASQLHAISAVWDALALRLGASTLVVGKHGDARVTAWRKQDDTPRYDGLQLPDGLPPTMAAAMRAELTALLDKVMAAVHHVHIEEEDDDTV